MKIQAIIPAAGKGVRLKAKTPKTLVRINNKPLFVYAAEVFQQCSLIDSIILVVDEKTKSEFRKAVREHKLTKVKKIIKGGRRRRDSVCQGLKALDKDTRTVVIHDGARPLVSKKILRQAIQLCSKHNACIVAVPVKPTIKRIDPQEMIVAATLDRRLLWEVQTPQVFSKELIVKAHRFDPQTDVTDDAFLVEQLGEPVKILPGDSHNIKVTTQDDLIVAEHLLNKQRKKK